MTSIALTNVTVTKVTSEQVEQTSDLIASEAPLQIVLKYFDRTTYVEKPISITMRSRGNDEALVIGFLFAEGIITSIEQISLVRYCNSSEEKEVNENRMIVTLVKSVDIDEKLLARNFMMNSSCGVCGKELLNQLVNTFEPIMSTKKIKLSVLTSLSEKLQKHQLLFKYTGGIHACGLFDFNGNVLAVYEDIGRHNALDKVIGSMLLKKLSFSNTVIVLSGRIGYEMMQKSAKAKIPVVLAIGAPTSLAVDIAKTTEICLIGFVKEKKMNIYSYANRINL